MPVIRIEYDNNIVNQADMLALSEAINDMVLQAKEVTNPEDSVVYTNSAQIKVNIHPVEIFIQMTAHKIKDIDRLMAELESSLTAWKQERNFTAPITLNISPENWKIKAGI